MLYQIPCNALTQNYLWVKLNAHPMTPLDPVGFYLFLLCQTSKRGPDARSPDFSFHYPARMDTVHGSRNTGSLLNHNEIQMLNDLVKYVLRSELIVLLDESDDYNETFFEFQEKYNLNDMMMSRDEMYKWYERVKSGFTKHQFKMPERFTDIGWPPDYMG